MQPMAGSDMTDPVATVEYRGRTVRYYVPNDISQWRVDTLFDKEPDTVEWLSRFSSGDVFYDIGANMGLYTLFAAMVADCQVCAFEPESQNFYLLMKNIVLNGCGTRVIAYPVAIYDREMLGTLHIGDFRLAQAIHSFDQKVDAYLNPTDYSIRQGAASFTLDYIVNSGACPPPTRIKIDVDGLEHTIFAGMQKVLSRPQLQSVLIEINTNLAEHRSIITRMGDLGFRHDPEQVRHAMRTSGRFAGLGNHIFWRT